MRLQLLIHRHALPPVRIVHTTGTGPASHTRSPASTIADLLNDVNDIIPLESEDGEWGLEDYVVEVAGLDSASNYECLHFQVVEDVLREFDEVTIRALSSEDLRVRRLSGRHQISGDGRHLIDGVAFGKQWLRKTSRPGILIPPRKKRKLLMDETDVEGEEHVKQILGLEEDYTMALVPFTGDDEDDDDEEEDEDFIDEAEEDDVPYQITLREDFDDADTESEDDPDLSDEGFGLRDDNIPDEVKLLLEDAADLENARNERIARRVLERQLKRKRDIEDDGEEGADTIFEGFSSPVKNQDGVQGEDQSDWEDDADADSLMNEIANQQAEKVAKNIIEVDNEDDDDDDDDDFEEEEKGEGEEDDDTSDSDTTSDSDSSSSDSDADGKMEDVAMQQAKKRVLSLIRQSDDGALMKSDPESEEDASSDSESDEDDNARGETSSSGSDSASEEDSESGSSTSSESESEREGQEPEQKSKDSTKPMAGSLSTVELPAIAPQNETERFVGVPFQGTARTRSNNLRAKRKKKLNMLKEQGLLPENADFKALEAYEEEQESKKPATDTSSSLEQEHDAKVDGITKPIEPLQDDMPVDEGNGDDNMEPRNSEGSVPGTALIDISAPPAVDSQADPQSESEAVTESSPRRARLDLASSRRMLFASLGLRNPKTPEAEQALREKLSQSARPFKPRSSSTVDSAAESPQIQPSPADDDSWKSNLIVTAVECERTGVVLPPPPFPFQQGWSKPSLNHPNKRRLRDQAQYYQNKGSQGPNYHEEDVAEGISTLDYGDAETSNVANEADSTPASHETANDMQAHQDFDTLPALDQANILPGAMIAYKELHVDASTNYQPEVSAYRIGQVSGMDEDGTVHIKLAQNSFQKDTINQSGERIYGKFELQTDEDQIEIDDGSREMLFPNMISAKLVQASSVEVPASNHVNGLRGGEAPILSSDHNPAFIPESAEDKVESEISGRPQISVDEIATPRKQEISEMIKEAGFESALDDQLLMPITNPPEAAAESQSAETYLHRFRRRSPRSQLPSAHGTRSSIVDDSLDFDDEPNGVDINLHSVLPESSPIIHTQETVEYPHISQMEINSSEPIPTANSSSHQDAQKISPAPPVDLSFTTTEQDPLVDQEESIFDKAEPDGDDDEASQSHDASPALKRELPQSSAARSSSQSQGAGAEQKDSPEQSSFLSVLGYDGHDSSHPDEDESDQESDYLPSLHEITSSQKYARQTRSSLNKVSPPPVRKSLRSANKRHASTPASSPGLPPSSQPPMKSSQSQRELRLSQIPPGSQVVDLTFSSSPHKDENDMSYGKEKTGSQVNGNGGRKTNSFAAKQEVGQGIGTRRLLTTKKQRGYY